MEEVPDHDMREPHGARTRTSAFACHHHAARTPSAAAAATQCHPARRVDLLTSTADTQVGLQTIPTS